ncbi:ribosomal-processing cysteine protease Prp [bacterium]|nr:ribosomal-processing cysteine protease Prp [bacterium]MDY3861352.1 ribosomal-processing cysteine protease Prp [Ruminococcus sp.]
MIDVKFFKSDYELVGFEVSGHSDYSESGSDIVCAAVSSAAFMTANTLTEILNVKVDLQYSDDGLIRLMLCTADAKACKVVMQGFKLHIVALQEQYKNHIKVDILEV